MGCPGRTRVTSRPKGKTSRNTFEGRKTEVSGNSQADVGAMPVSIRSPLIATNDAMHSTDLEVIRVRYDDRPFKRCRAADSKIQRRRRFAG